MKKFVKDTSKKLATGALAILATIGGSSFGVFAGPNTPTGSIGTDLSGHSGASANPPTNDWTSGDELHLDDTGMYDSYGSMIPVKGYQTSKVYNYELKVSWGDMKFVFDRGVYNPTSNKLTKKLAGDTIYKYCEAGVDNGSGVASGDTSGTGVGKWCGFDGTNNRVNVENLGNGNINMIAKCVESNVSAAGSPAGNSHPVDMQVGYIASEEVSGANDDRWVFSSDSENDITTATMRTGDSDTTASMKFGKDDTVSASAVVQKAFDLAGNAVSTQANSNEVRFYLNITGTPAPGDGTAVSSANDSQLDVKEETPSTDDGWEEIGNIELLFRTIGEGTTPDPIETN